MQSVDCVSIFGAHFIMNLLNKLINQSDVTNTKLISVERCFRTFSAALVSCGGRADFYRRSMRKSSLQTHLKNIFGCLYKMRFTTDENKI